MPKPSPIPELNDHIDLTADAPRRALSKMVMQMFRLWGLPTSDKLQLLGLSPTSRATLARYSRGVALPATRDMLDRVGWLLAIHKALRLLYPHNEEIRYSWVSRRNTAFNNFTPLEVMNEQGIIGIARVARYLDSVTGAPDAMYHDIK